MKKNMMNTIMAALMILLFTGWGSGVLAENPYSAGERGFPDPWFLTGSDDGTSDLPGPALITGEGYCYTISSGTTSESYDAYSEGERGIANHPATFAGIDKPALKESEALSDERLLCLKTGSDNPSTEDDFNYSWGSAGEVH
jgi:hypothetical protein